MLGGGGRGSQGEDDFIVERQDCNTMEETVMHNIMIANKEEPEVTKHNLPTWNSRQVMQRSLGRGNVGLGAEA